MKWKWNGETLARKGSSGRDPNCSKICHIPQRNSLDSQIIIIRSSDCQIFKSSDLPAASPKVATWSLHLLAKRKRPRNCSSCEKEDANKSANLDEKTKCKCNSSKNIGCNERCPIVTRCRMMIHPTPGFGKVQSTRKLDSKFHQLSVPAQHEFRNGNCQMAPAFFKFF